MLYFTIEEYNKRKIAQRRWIYIKKIYIKKTRNISRGWTQP